MVILKQGDQPMTKSFSIAEAKTHLSDYVRQVEQGNSILITRHGKPVAALVSAEALEHVERLRKAGPQAGLASLAGGWENSEDLIRAIAHTPRTRSRKRVVLE
jgi:prevent-host-death family protein